MSPDPDSRPPLDAAGATPEGSRWHVEVLETCPSTNAEVAERFRSGEEEGLVLAAEDQTAGRGRLGRDWVTPPRASLTVSFLLVPDGVPPERWPWLPLLTGVAAADAVRRTAGAAVDLKWPNDVLAEGRKLAGILLERVERPDGTAAAVLGIGINCSQGQEELPVPEATSLQLLTGEEVDRTALLEALVEDVASRLEQWAGPGLADLQADYRALCITPGQQVRVAVPGGDVAGEAVEVDDDGRLVVRTADGEERLGAGDVVHVRPDA
jgi:BirA family biotin operon repressor/biotin-[acetyl-CoA-carboxylase] ligase